MAALTIGVGTRRNRRRACGARSVRHGWRLAATALKPAVRLEPDGTIIFPMNPLPKCALSKTQLRPAPAAAVACTRASTSWRRSAKRSMPSTTACSPSRSINGASNATLSGNAWYLTMPDRTYYFYAHLSAFAAGLAAGSAVTRGQLIGYVGDTGDPGPGNYHLHFEVHPKGARRSIRTHC